MTVRVSSAGRTALWIGGGGLAGLAVGGLLTNPDRAIELSPIWALITLSYVALVVAFTRRNEASAPLPAAASAPRAPARAAPDALPAGPARAPSTTLGVRFELPDVPEGFPPVFGQTERVRVRVLATRGAQPAQGAAVRFEALLHERRQSSDGVTGEDGSVEFDVEPEHAGELRLHADVNLDRARGQAEETLSIVRYEDEIQRLYGEFRAFALDVLGTSAESYTARELAEKLRSRAGADVARAVLELSRIYELVAYGEREADRRAYLAVTQQLLLLENADLPGEPPATAPAREA